MKGWLRDLTFRSEEGSSIGGKDGGRLADIDARDNAATVGGGKDLPLPYIVVRSTTAGAAIAWLTSPRDMTKLRIQV